MNIIDIITSKIKIARHQAMVNRVIADTPAIAASFGWDPQTEWVINAVDFWSKHCMHFNEHRFRYTITQHFDTSKYWKYIDEGAVRITAHYGDRSTPSPLEVISNASGIINVLDNLGYNEINRIVIKSSVTKLYWYNDLLAFEFATCGRRAHHNSALPAENASRLIMDLIGIELKSEDIVQPDFGEYNDITFLCGEDGVWSQTISTAVYRS